MSRKNYEMSNAQAEMIENAPLSKEEKAQLKVDKFKKNGTIRLNNAIDKILLLKNLANTTAYTYTEAQKEVIFNALDDAVAQVKVAFEAKSVEEKAKIEL